MLDLKDSGSSWISRIPKHWKIKKLKFLTSPRKELSDTGKEELLSVTEARGIVKRREIRSSDEPLFRADNLVGYRKVRTGDLVSNIMLMWKRGLGVSEFEGIVSPAYSVFKFSDECDTKYFHYLLRSEEYITEFRKNSTGITMSRLRLYDDSFGAMYSHLPPLEEQKFISHYLDKKTKQIDSLIEKIKKKIELLKEQRISLINHCVTKGLDPNVEMKDSRVEWIGQIPKHWEMSKTNFLSVNLDGKRIPLNSEQRHGNKGNIPYWGSNGIIDYIDDYLFDEKLVLVGEDGSPFFEKDKSVSFVSKGKVWINNHIHVLRTKSNVAPEWLSASFNITDYKEYITGSTRDKLTQSDLKRIPHPLPPLEEQKIISRYLDKKAEQIDSLIEKNQKKIELLKEYRQSLISSVVTGKIRITEDMV